MKNINLKFVNLIICMLLISCNSDIKFDKTGWNQKGDLNNYPNREKMLNDLMENHKIKGLKYSELVNLLGEPEIEKTSENITAYYNIATEYGLDIDPVYIKNLVISLSIDSTAQSCIVTNWKK
jgi:hypothetical protein